MASSALLLDDSAAQTRLISGMLAKKGWAAVLAGDVQCALRVAKSTPVSLMLIDVLSSAGGAADGVVELRAAAPKTPIGLMTPVRPTPKMLEAANETAQRAGCEFLLGKPFGLDELSHVLVQTKAIEARRRAPRILIIDDAVIVRTLAKNIAEEAGFVVLEATSMEEALETLSVARVDLVITDIFMPGMGGIAGISKVRARWPDLPILAMSAGLNAQADAGVTLSAAERVGATGVLPKPFLPDQLKAAIRSVLDQAKVQAARSAVTLTTVAAAATRPAQVKLLNGSAG